MKQETFLNRPTDKPEKFNFTEVGQLRGPVEKILKHLYPKIIAGEYGVIIGDDASGRIPALLFNDFIAGVYKEYGFEKPDIRFIAGSKDLHDEEKETKKKLIFEYLNKIRENLPETNASKKALIVTDVINTGVSLDPLIEVLKEIGMGFDVACIGDDTTQDVEKRWGKEVYFGEPGIPYIYGFGSISGVEKKTTELFSTPIKNNPTYSKDEKKDIQLSINESREDVRLLAGQILETLKKKK